MCDVSVIIPNYNHALYLEKRIESILNQTFRNFEIIILDDHSNDDSLLIIDKYKDHPKVSRIIINEKNSGSTFKQWKKGIGESKGKYILIAESDDFSDENFLEKIIVEIEVKNAGIAFCQSYFINERDEIIYEPQSETTNYSTSGNDFVINKMTLGNSIYNASAVVFKKDLALKIDIPDLLYCGDWFFWVEILRKTDIAVISEKLNYFRRHSKSISTHSEKEGLQYIEGFKILKHIKSNFDIDSKEWKKIIYKWSYRWSEFLICNKTSFGIHFRIFMSSLRLDVRIAYYTIKYLYYNLLKKNEG
jgi:glycosyltransferase involved in cell wall biosynthesis